MIVRSWVPCFQMARIRVQGVPGPKPAMKMLAPLGISATASAKDPRTLLCIDPPYRGFRAGGRIRREQRSVTGGESATGIKQQATRDAGHLRRGGLWT